MLTAKFFLGLDFGTSGARVCVLDEAEMEIHQDHIPWPDPPEQTPMDWREALHTLLKRLPADLTAELQGIAVAATSATVLLCDEELEPTSPALLYVVPTVSQRSAFTSIPILIVAAVPFAGLLCTIQISRTF